MSAAYCAYSQFALFDATLRHVASRGAQGDLKPVSIHEKKLKASGLQNPSVQAIAKILRARASEHLSNFCEQFEQRPNLASTLKLNGTIRYPFNN